MNATMRTWVVMGAVAIATLLGSGALSAQAQCYGPGYSGRGSYGSGYGYAPRAYSYGGGGYYGGYNRSSGYYAPRAGAYYGNSYYGRGYGRGYGHSGYRGHYR